MRRPAWNRSAWPRDVNMGCPARKVCRVGGGSTMMTELARTARLVKGMVDAVRIPVTAKMRLGWDEENLTAPELARALEEAGVAGVFVHGRTRAQGFRGQVNLAGIRAVAQAVKKIPVIGNGDVTTPEAAQTMLNQTGCAGVGIGRGAFYNPWIFQHTRHYLQTGQLLPEPSFEERVRVMCRHLDRMIEVFGEAHGCRMFRKIAPWHARRFGPAKEFTHRVVRVSSRAEFLEILERYRIWRRQFLDSTASCCRASARRPGGARSCAHPIPPGTASSPRPKRAGRNVVARQTWRRPARLAGPRREARGAAGTLQFNRGDSVEKPIHASPRHWSSIGTWTPDRSYNKPCWRI